MDYTKNKEARGQNRASDETEMVVRDNLSKDGKTLDLTAAYLKEYGAKDIASFEFLSDLNTLELGTNLIGAKGAKYLSKSTVLTNLKTLNLFYNEIGNDGVKFIAVSDNLQSLQNLVLSDNNITDEGALMLAKFLPLFPNLLRLDMRLNKLKEEGKQALEEAKKISKVKHLLLDKVEGFQVKA